MGSAVVSPCSGLVTHPDVKDAWADAGSTRLTRSGRWSKARFGSVPLVRRRDTRASPRGVKTQDTKILHTALTRRRSGHTMRQPPPAVAAPRHRHRAAIARRAKRTPATSLHHQPRHRLTPAEMPARGAPTPPLVAADPRPTHAGPLEASAALPEDRNHRQPTGNVRQPYARPADALGAKTKAARRR
jgi:hypothetical protein